MNSNHQLLIKDIQIISNISLPYSQSVPTNVIEMNILDQIKKNI
jgi:hypothetical protein